MSLCFALWWGESSTDSLGNFEHFRNVDAAKEKGAEGSIEELRKKRFLQNEWGMTWDYSPLIRRQITKTGITVDVFTAEDFKRARNDRNGFSKDVDAFLCFLIKQAGSDPRKDIFFDRTFLPTIRYVVRYQGQRISIALELLPKWKPTIEREARKRILTLTGEKKSKKEDEQQEAMEGLFKGARTRDKEKGSATNWLLKNIRYNLGKAFERLSTEDRVEMRIELDAYELFGGNKELAEKCLESRILMEKTEQSGGRLDHPITQGNQAEEDDEPTTRKESLSASRGPREEEEKNVNAILVKEFLEEKPELSNILEKERIGEPLSESERQTKQRSVKRLQKKHKHR